MKTGTRYGGLSPHQPFQFMSGQGPRIGPNMFLPRIHAPTFWKPREAKSSATPVVPPSLPNRARWSVRVGSSHWCRSVPPMPSGLLTSWFGPAPYPSSEMVKLSTRTRVIFIPQSRRLTVELSRREAKPSGRLERLVIRPWLPTRVSLANRHALAELLGKRDNDALRPADVG